VTRTSRARYRREEACDTCWSKFSLQYNRFLRFQPDAVEADEFNGWLARKLIVDIKRLEKFGVIGGCEAISSWKYTNDSGNRGKQCLCDALYVRDGRRVCDAHNYSKEVIFVPETDGYTVITRLVRHLSKIDDAFRGAIISGLEPE
jgi:hypothetical protein